PRRRQPTLHPRRPRTRDTLLRRARQRPLRLVHGPLQPPPRRHRARPPPPRPLGRAQRPPLFRLSLLRIDLDAPAPSPRRPRSLRPAGVARRLAHLVPPRSRHPRLSQTPRPTCCPVVMNPGRLSAFPADIREAHARWLADRDLDALDRVILAIVAFHLPSRTRDEPLVHPQ